jgi:hypothetical protein
MENSAQKLAPVEHRVSFLGKDPTATRFDYRIRCQCGWTEKVGQHWRSSTGKEHEELASSARYTLMLRWERHVYTPEERRILAELEGS